MNFEIFDANSPEAKVIARAVALPASANKSSPMDKEYLREMARVLEAKLPDNHAFILLSQPFGDTPGRLIYTANCERADAIKLLKEFLFKCGELEDWMKHVS